MTALTRAELIASLQNEVRILLHLAGKVNPARLDYRPTATQRSTIELLRYLAMMGPALVKVARDGAFDADAWTAAEKATEALTLEETKAAIASHTDEYKVLLEALTEEDLGTPLTMFGSTASRGAIIVNQVLGGCAAYRTQLFLYLKASGRPELDTMNLWAGMDSPAVA